MDRELADRVALVTGCGNPLGIGMACAMVLGSRGSTALHHLDDRSHRTARCRASIRRHDVETDIVVNNAGMVNVGLSDFEFLDFLEMDPATWDLEIAMNLATAFKVTHAAVPDMVRSGWGAS